LVITRGWVKGTGTGSSLVDGLLPSPYLVCSNGSILFLCVLILIIELFSGAHWSVYAFIVTLFHGPSFDPWAPGTNFSSADFGKGGRVPIGLVSSAGISFGGYASTWATLFHGPSLDPSILDGGHGGRCPTGLLSSAGISLGGWAL